MLKIQIRRTIFAGVFLLALTSKVQSCLQYIDPLYSGLVNSYQAQREISTVATIEALAVVDHTLAEILGSDEEINNYISANWNAADRYYRQFKDPEIKLKLVGLHILRSEAEEGFFVYRPGSAGSILHHKTLTQMVGWLAKHKDILPKHDLAYLHFGIRNWEGRGGTSFCKAGGTTDSVAYGDTWGESSSAPRVTAHEVGHVLGAAHCKESGYVMCSGAKVSNFSAESAKVIHNTIKSHLGGCISKFDAPDEQLSKFNFNRTIMPGDVVSLDVQCERYHLVKGMKAVHSESDCDNLKCQKPDGTKKSSNMPAIGTTELCPKGQRCFEGVCKAE